MQRGQSVAEADRDIRTFLVRIAGSVGDFLGESLRGIYVYGSLAAGSFRRNSSDIDILIVARTSLGTRDREGLAKVLVALSRARPTPGDIEAHVVTEGSARNFQHPMPFEVHYSAGVRGDIERGRHDFAGQRHYANLALAIHETRERGLRLVGPEPQSLFAFVPWHARINAVEDSFRWAGARVSRNPVYAALNAALTLHAVAERETHVLSKEEAARWAVLALPEALRPGLQAALEVRLGERGALDEQEVSNVRALREYVLERAAPAFAKARPVEGDEEDDEG